MFAKMLGKAMLESAEGGSRSAANNKSLKDLHPETDLCIVIVYTMYSQCIYKMIYQL